MIKIQGTQSARRSRFAKADGRAIVVGVEGGVNDLENEIIDSVDILIIGMGASTECDEKI